MKENNYIGKTILTIYRYLPRVCKSLDKIIESRGVGSFYYSKDNFNDTMTVANIIIELSQRKINLINLKITIDKILLDMKEDLARILIYKFIEGKKSEDIAKIINFSSRTYFRKVGTAVCEFEKRFIENGYSNLKFVELINDEKWIKSVFDNFNDINEKQKQSVEFDFSASIVRNVKNELKSVILQNI